MQLLLAAAGTRKGGKGESNANGGQLALRNPAAKPSRRVLAMSPVRRVAQFTGLGPFPMILMQELACPPVGEVAAAAIRSMRSYFRQMPNERAEATFSRKRRLGRS